jgi:hypothetical protein
MAVIIRRTKGIEPIGFSDLFAEEEALPTAWNAAHVGLRLVEAFTTVLKMPGGRTGYRSLWPAYMYEFDDLVAQAEQGELEITQRTQNKVRIAPSTPEITTMEKALAWPMKFLSAKHPQICEAVNDLARACARPRCRLVREEARRICRRLAPAARSRLRGYRAGARVGSHGRVLRGARRVDHDQKELTQQTHPAVRGRHQRACCRR